LDQFNTRILEEKTTESLATPAVACAPPPHKCITVESAKKYKSHKKRECFNLIKSNNANNGLPLFVHFLQDLYRRSCRTGAALRACPGSASSFFMLCFLLVKFINLLNMDDYGLLCLQHFQQLWPPPPAASQFFIEVSCLFILL
jgi:hypothetical protein